MCPPIRGSLSRAENNRIHIVPLPDDPYDDTAWAQSLESKVRHMVNTFTHLQTTAPKIGLIGDSGSATSYYLDRFSRWERLNVPNLNRINGTAIRDRLFGAQDVTMALTYLSGDQARAELPASIIQTLKKFCATSDYAGLKAEYDFLARYRADWRATPYPPVFVTVDAVVTHGQQLLLIERNNYPGRGLWALPGGFINQHELLVDACIRELLEETRLTHSAAVLKDNIKSRRVFDYPYRSLLGRIITHAFHFDLEATGPLPAVSGGDDASHARWTPLAEIDPTRLHDDHYFIIRDMLGV